MVCRPALCVIGLALSMATGGAQPLPATAPDMSRLEARIQDLQDEAARLARMSRTLVTDLRALEVERDLRTAEAARAEAALADADGRVAEIEGRLRRLEQEHAALLPGLEAQLVGLYTRGPLGYARLLLAARDVRDLGRTSRAVAAMAAVDGRRLRAHQHTVSELRAERQRHAGAVDGLQARQAEAVAARTAAARAVAAHAGRLNDIDARRDLAAQYVGELRAAREALTARLTEGTRTAVVPLPLAPFRGALDWPSAGAVSAGFGQTRNRLGGSAVRNGIEIAATPGAPVTAVHGGTVVHADVYPGFGQLVIVDHGRNAFSLYGYLGRITVSTGRAVGAGAELGRVGTSPAGPPALYFELRVDGESVDPVQWLRPR